MNKYFQHFKTICKHKFYVFQEARRLNIFWRGLFHDMSKFSPQEFFSSARYFCGDRSPISREKEEKGYSLAWQHHHNHNPHHWEYWMDGLTPVEIPMKYVREMICDWIGAGKAYNKAVWTRSTPFNWFKSQLEEHKVILHKETEEIIYFILLGYSIGYNLLFLFDMSVHDDLRKEYIKLWEE